MAASPLTKSIGSSTCDVDRQQRPLAAGTKVFRRGLAACKAGFYRPASGDPDEIVVGEFWDEVDNTAGADGAKLADIKFGRTRRLRLVDNDTDAPVVAADREKPCSLLDDHTATSFTAAKGAAATVFDVTDEGVWIEMTYPSSSDDAGVPRIQAGTATLVAGTKTITGVTLTANSRIVVTMKDPGAGAITGLVGFDAPAASRNAGSGQFVVNAIDASKAVINTAVCTVDYVIVG